MEEKLRQKVKLFLQKGSIGRKNKVKKRSTENKIKKIGTKLKTKR